jgi:hypothetical protein
MKISMGCGLDPPFYHCMNQYLPLLQQIETYYKTCDSIFIAGMKYGNGKVEAPKMKNEGFTIALQVGVLEHGHSVYARIGIIIKYNRQKDLFIFQSSDGLHACLYFLCRKKVEA